MFSTYLDSCITVCLFLTFSLLFSVCIEERASSHASRAHEFSTVLFHEKKGYVEPEVGNRFHKVKAEPARIALLEYALFNKRQLDTANANINTTKNVVCDIEAKVDSLQTSTDDVKKNTEELVGEVQDMRVAMFEFKQEIKEMKEALQVLTKQPPAAAAVRDEDNIQVLSDGKTMTPENRALSRDGNVIMPKKNFFRFVCPFVSKYFVI